MYYPNPKGSETMKRITKIEAAGTKQKKLRVAAYARVSTDSDKQLVSLETQKNHYEKYIKARPDWKFAGLYFDEGISGTKMDRRDGLKRLLEDCDKGLIDYIVVKSISRLARNTVDTIEIVRKLFQQGIFIYFEKENINTLDAKGEVLMTIMAALAQQESESLSANVRLGIQFRNQQGKVQVNHNRFLGYTKDENGKLVIVPEQAEIVKRIYAEYMDGASFLQIKRGLEADGILNGAGNKKWEVSNIRQILTNEKYIGDALLQKTYTVSVLEKKRVKNDGQVPKYYVEGSHEAIIDRDVFLRVQAEIDRRANIIKGGKKRVYSSKYALSSVIICGHCGDIFRRIKWNNHGCKSTVWRCVSRVNKKKSGIHCPARTVHEEVIQAAVVTAINDAWSRKDEILPQLKENIRAVLQEDTDAKIAEIDTAVKEKQEELLKVGKDENKIAEIGEAIMKLREERQQVMTDAAMHKDVTDRIEDLSNFLDEQTGAITEYSDALVRRLIEKITVYDEALVVKFKSGLEITVDA
jgi:site-specific DNA recombinase